MAFSIDCHVHTSRFSMCSTVTPEQLVEEAIDSGLDGLVLTEHNSFWPDDDLQYLREQYPEITLLNGAEVDVPSLHHVLTILPEPDRAVVDPASPEDFIQDVHDRGGMAIAAHPFRFYHDYDERNREYPLDGVEIASRNMHDSESLHRARQLAESWGAKMVSNSDAHSLDPIGRFYTTLSDPVTDETELIDSLRNQDVEPEVPHRD